MSNEEWRIEFRTFPDQTVQLSNVKRELGKNDDMRQPTISSIAARRANPGGDADHDRIGGNELLTRISKDVWSELQQHLKLIRVSPGTHLAHTGEAMNEIYFPRGGVIAIGAKHGDSLIATGLVGRDGFVGWPALLDRSDWPHDVIVRACETPIWRIDRTRFIEFASRYPGFREVLLQGVDAFMQQMARTITSNLVQSVEQRTARWIAMYHDRIEGDELVMTHRELGIMLGVRRPSITDALHGLEERGAIKGKRGRVVVRDADVLNDLARIDRTRDSG